MQIVFHCRKTKAKLSGVRTTCHHYSLNAFYCVEVWPSKSHFYSCRYFSSPLSLGLRRKHKPKINYSNCKAKENYGKFSVKILGAYKFLSHFSSHIIHLLFSHLVCLIMGENLRHCHRSPHTPQKQKTINVHFCENYLYHLISTLNFIDWDDK